MITRIDIKKLTSEPDFNHREFIRWLFDNVGDGIPVGSIYDLCKSSNKQWCWESTWGVKAKHEFLHIKNPEAAQLFKLVWLHN